MVDARLSRLREVAIEDLAVGFARDELSSQTHEARVEAALDARSASELREATWDLPAVRDVVVSLVLGCIDGVEVLANGRRLASEAPRFAWLLGRSSSCDVQFSADSVSRRHALVTKRGGCWSVSCLGATNGTWVNGVRVQRRRLAPGDRIDLGPDAALAVTGHRRASKWASRLRIGLTG